MNARPTEIPSDLEIDPTKTPIFIGVGVVNEGTIRLKNTNPNAGLRVVIAGEQIGDIDAPLDIVQVVQGGSLKPIAKLTCKHLVVGGRLVSPSAEIHAEKVSWLSTAVVSVSKVYAGSAEQQLGCHFNGQIIMGEQEPGVFDEQPSDAASSERTPTVAPAVSSFADEEIGASSIVIVNEIVPQ